LSLIQFGTVAVSGSFLKDNENVATESGGGEGWWEGVVCMCVHEGVGVKDITRKLRCLTAKREKRRRRSSGWPHVGRHENF